MSSTDIRNELCKYARKTVANKLVVGPGGNISAKYNNGILEITVPKDEKKVLKASIKVV